MKSPRMPERAGSLVVLPTLLLVGALFLPRPAPAPAAGAARTARQEAAKGKTGPEEKPPRLRIRRWSVSQALILPGEEVTVRVTVANEGGGTVGGVRIEAQPDAGLEIVEPGGPGKPEPPEKPEHAPGVKPEGPGKGGLGPGEEMEASWEVRPSKANRYWLHISATDDSGAVDRLDLPLAATRMPAPPPRMAATNPRVRTSAEQDFIFENKHFTAVLVKNTYGYGPVLYYPNAPRGRPRPPLLAAVLTPLSRAVWQEGSGRLRVADFYPAQARIINGQPRVHLEGEEKEGDQSWRFGADLQIEREPWMSTDYELQAVQSASLLHFSGPMLRVGEGDKGAAQRQAVFPGLEFLEKGETSSSGEYDDTPDRLRVAPDPHKITVPAMGITQENTLVALLWNPLQVWDGHERRPAAVFDSPNEVEDQDNHLMGLFLPSIPDYVPENETLASNPYRLPGGQSLRLRAKVAVEPDEREPTEAIRLWARAFGLPERPPLPRDYEAERVVSRRAFTETLWNPDVPGWNYALPADQFPAEPYQGPVVALLMDAALTGGATGEELRKQARVVIDALGGTDAPLEPRLAYRVGGVVPALEEARADALERMATQNLDGGWTWEGNDDHHDLGRHRQPEVGIVAANALPILRYAAATGDSAALTSGVRALTYMERFRVPRGGQADELPLDAPDLMAAAQAAECNALGFILTDRLEFLRNAESWADAGLPFIYFWHEPGREVQAFASVSAFGASNYERSWIGMARQHTGLLYARVLLLLNHLRGDPLYERVAAGIVGSAMQQQHAEGDLAGLIPDSWDMVDYRESEPYVNPERLLDAMYALQEYEMGLAYERARVGADRLYLASPHWLSHVNRTVTRLHLTLHSPGYEDGFTTVSGADSVPIAVRLNDRPLPQSGQETAIGREWLPDRTAVLLHGSHVPGHEALEVRFRHPVRSPRELRLEVPYVPKKPARVRRP